MTAQEARDLVKQGKALLIDVREEDELRQTGTAEDAVWMPLSAMVDDTDQWRAFQKTLPRDKKLIIYCKVGGRSARVCECLAEAGFETHNLGGFCEWTCAGLPTKPFAPR